LAAVDEILQIAKLRAARPDARVAWLVDWIRTHMVPGGRWTDRRFSAVFLIQCLGAIGVRALLLGEDPDFAR
jgi:hypothetical protein